MGLLPPNRGSNMLVRMVNPSKTYLPQKIGIPQQDYAVRHRETVVPNVKNMQTCSTKDLENENSKKSLKCRQRLTLFRCQRTFLIDTDNHGVDLAKIFCSSINPYKPATIFWYLKYFMIAHCRNSEGFSILTRYEGMTSLQAFPSGF